LPTRSSALTKERETWRQMLIKVRERGVTCEQAGKEGVVFGQQNAEGGLAISYQLLYQSLCFGGRLNVARRGERPGFTGFHHTHKLSQPQKTSLEYGSAAVDCLCKVGVQMKKT
jgi:hypothetical protein